MKKGLGFVLGAVFLFVPLLANAQTTNKASLLAALESLLQALENEIAVLEAQQQAYGSMPQSVASSQTYTTPSGAVVDQSGNTVSTPTTTTVQEATPTPTPTPAPYVYVDPLLPQWESKLSADIFACQDPSLYVGAQGNESAACSIDSEDAITEAKLAINAGMTVSDASSDTETINGIVQSLEQEAGSYLTSGGPSGGPQGTAAALEAVASNWQQVMSILTTRQWE